MTAIEMFTLTDTLMAFGVALGSLGVIAAVGFAGSAVRGALTGAPQRSATAHWQPRPRSTR